MSSKKVVIFSAPSGAGKTSLVRHLLEQGLPLEFSISACSRAPRANEQFFNNASENTKCIYTGSLAGLLPAGPGHSHQMVRDISVLGGVPNPDITGALM